MKLKLIDREKIKYKPEGVVIDSSIGEFFIEGNDVKILIDSLVPLLDGTRTTDDILANTEQDLHANYTNLLQLMDRLGLIEEENSSWSEWYEVMGNRQRLFWHIWGEDLRRGLSNKLRSSSILILGDDLWIVITAIELATMGLGKLTLHSDTCAKRSGTYVPRFLRARLGMKMETPFRQYLSEIAPWCSVHTISDGHIEAEFSGHDLVVTSPRFSAHLMGKLENSILGTSAKVLYGSFHKMEAYIGPLFIPKLGGCWYCAESRLNAPSNFLNLSNSSKFMANEIVDYSSTRLISMDPLLGHLVALEAVKVVTNFIDSTLLNSVQILDLISMDSSNHKFVPPPVCAVCGGAEAINLGNDQAENNTLQIKDVLLDISSNWVDERLGVISRLGIRDEEREAPRIPICADAFLKADFWEMEKKKGSTVVGGKGINRESALISAIGEAIERYSATIILENKLTFCPSNQLSGDVLSPLDLGLYSDSQYDRPEFPFQRYNDSEPHYWIRGTWCDTLKPVWAPALVTFFSWPIGAEQPYCQVTTNGMASGLSIEDASLRAVYELVERDAAVLTWMCRLPVRGIYVNDQLQRSVLEVIQELAFVGIDVELYLLDVGHALPVILALGLGDGVNWPSLAVGTAAHLDPQNAILNAVTELGYTAKNVRNSALLTPHLEKMKPKDVRSFMDHGIYYMPSGRAENCEFIRNTQGYISVMEITQPEDLSLEYCIALLANNGIRVACIDITSADVAMSPFRVVRGLSSDLQPIHAGYGLERTMCNRLRETDHGNLNHEIHPYS